MASWLYLPFINTRNSLCIFRKSLDLPGSNELSSHKIIIQYGRRLMLVHSRDATKRKSATKYSSCAMSLILTNFSNLACKRFILKQKSLPSIILDSKMRFDHLIYEFTQNRGYCLFQSIVISFAQSSLTYINSQNYCIRTAIVEYW